ncbi:MAG: lipid II flippase MurJ, partial [Nitrospirota bacterium]
MAYPVIASLSKPKAMLFNLLRRGLVRDTLWTTFFSTIGKSLGFLIPFFIAAWFGVTSETDAFFFAYGIILFLSGIFAPVVESIIVPYIAEAISRNEDTGRFVGNILGVSGGALLVLLAAFVLLIKPALSLVTHFDPQTVRLVFWLLVETAPLFVLLVWTSVLAGTLNAYKRFAFPALSPGIRALVCLGIIFAFKDTYGVHAIAIGYVAGELLRLGSVFWVIKWLRLFKLRVSFRLSAKLREFLQTASYQMAGMAVIGINPIVDKAMASWLGKGSVSVLHYADRLYMIPVTFVSTGLMVTLLSHWSGRYYEEGIERLHGDVKKAIKIVGLLALFITLALVLVRQPLVRLAFGRGAFDQTMLPEVGWVWVCYLLGFVPYMTGTVFLRAHLALKNTKVIMQYGFFVVGLNVLLNYILMKYFRVAGIALATS